MKSFRHFVSFMRQRCYHLACDQRGISAIEFSLLMPLMMVMYFGSIEVTDAISADRQVTLVASTVADITTEYTSIAASDVTNILAAASAVLSPFPMTNGQVVLSSVVIDANGNAYVDWSATQNGSQRSGNVTSMVPTALRVANTSLIWGEATYVYKPSLGYVITGSFNLYNQIFMRPRLSACVQYTGSYCSGGAVNAP